MPLAVGTAVVVSSKDELTLLWSKSAAALLGGDESRSSPFGPQRVSRRRPNDWRRSGSQSSRDGRWGPNEDPKGGTGYHSKDE